MKFIIVLAALVACAGAQFQQQQQQQRPLSQRPAVRSDEIQILRYENENNGEGAYSYSFELSDGTSASQKGYLKPAQGTDEPIQVQEGQFSYTAPEGEQIKLEYLADENGFQPRGEHLPTSPPIPEAIARALEIIYKNAGEQTRAAAAGGSSGFSNQRQSQQGFQSSGFSNQRPRQSGFQSQPSSFGQSQSGSGSGSGFSRF